MNFFIDAYDLFIKAIAYAIAFPFTESVIVALLCVYILKKIGVTRFLWIKLLSLSPLSDDDQGIDRNMKYRLFRDLSNLTLLFFVTIKLPLWIINMDLFFYKDYVYDRTNPAYKLERDELLEGAGMIGLPLFPYVWIPVVVGINKYRQWVDIETMVTWKYHDQRRQCFWSGYTDSSCGYAMDMARTLYRDDESLEIGKKNVEASKDGSVYDYCYALGRLQQHAEETDNVEMYKKKVAKMCELDCHKACENLEITTRFSNSLLKSNIFQNRRSFSSFITKYE